MKSHTFSLGKTMENPIAGSQYSNKCLEEVLFSSSVTVMTARTTGHSHHGSSEIVFWTFSFKLSHELIKGSITCIKCRYKKLLGGFKHGCYFPYMGCHPEPIDEVHHFSRWAHCTTNQMNRLLGPPGLTHDSS